MRKACGGSSAESGRSGSRSAKPAAYVATSSAASRRCAACGGGGCARGWAWPAHEKVAPNPKTHPPNLYEGRMAGNEE